MTERALGYAFLLYVAVISSGAAATSVSIAPVADTTLSENYPSNNLGGLTFFIAGTTQNRTRNRGLLRFDVSNAIPANSRVISAELVLEVVGEPNEPPAFADFALHRALKSWVEGTNISPQNCSSCKGQGSLATAGEATWALPNPGPANPWSTPGGATQQDFASQVSASTTIYGVVDSPYSLSSPGLVQDVQQWLDAPATNYGWLLLITDEDAPLTARRFASREDAGNAPRLNIVYEEPLRIESTRIYGGVFQFEFGALPERRYTVEMRLPNAGKWTQGPDYGPYPNAVIVVHTNLLGATAAWFRVVQH